MEQQRKGKKEYERAKEKKNDYERRKGKRTTTRNELKQENGEKKQKK